ncbi:MAG: hypothetical protein ACOZAO_01270 [Patescibacteria group bacterium]
MTKRLLTTTFITLLITGVFVLVPRNVFAQDSCNIGEVNGCTFTPAPDGNAEKCLFEGERANHPLLDIRRTMKNSIVSLLVDTGTSVATGRSLNQIIDCIGQEYANICNAGSDQDYWNAVGEQCGFSVIPGSNAAARARGSLAGITYTVGSAMSADHPIPTNLAHYFRYQVRNVPVLGDRVYAQVDYNILGADFILQLWQVFRNVAYGILAIVMIVIGVMIMVRKKISPQVIVTVQNALPRVVLGVLLITFSYPIGATGAALIWPLRTVVDGIMNDLGAGFAVSEAGFGAIVMLIITAVIAGMFFGGPIGVMAIGLSAVSLTIMVMLIWIIILLIALMKTITVYVRILMMIVFAPVQFAIGTVPGNEKMIKDWFKLLAARIVAIPAMYFMISLAGFIINQSLNAGFDPAASPAGSELLAWLEASGQTAVIMLFVPFLSIYLLITAVGMPKKIEKLFMGIKR